MTQTRPLTPSEAARISRDYGAQCKPGQAVQIIPRGESVDNAPITPREFTRRGVAISARNRKFAALKRREATCQGQ